jgi:Leucine-rich repeat (LRR) protein
VKPLAALTALQYLHLDGNQIGDVGPLAALTNIQALDLRNNRITDVSPLSKLTAWAELYLDRNQIADVKPLVAIAEKDATAKIVPPRTLTLKGNPLSAAARSQELPEIQKRLFDVVVN